MRLENESGSVPGIRTETSASQRRSHMSDKTRLVEVILTDVPAKSGCEKVGFERDIKTRCWLDMDHYR
jgi:hypothetical protein